MKSSEARAAAFLAIALWTALSVARASAYDLKAHRNITERAIEKSDFGASIAWQLLDVSQILDCEGTDAVAKNDRTAGGWVREGAVREDDYGLGESASFRFRNHFYNPLNGQGYSFWLISGIPAPDWALDDHAQYDQQLYSLRRAHDYYYASLTASSPDTRTQQLALTYCTLGHVMHLIEDMAQPQHTRNDSHGTYSAYEKYTDGDQVVDSLPFDGYPLVYGAQDRTTFNTPRNLWHTDEPSVRDRKGLADYSNRGFVTEGTNFMSVVNPFSGEETVWPSDPLFQEPSGVDATFWQTAIDTLTPCKWRDPEFQPHGLLRFVRTTVHDAYTNTDDVNPKTSTESVFDPDLDLLSQPKTFSLNCYTFEAAQNLLIPRAVGYSAGLLNYFFRGAFSVHYQGQYGNGGGYVVRNDTAEAMDGTLGIYYDDAAGHRLHITDRHIALGPAGRPDSIQPFQFTAAASDTCLRGEYQGVFRGQLGLEADAVIPAAGAFSPAVAGPTVYVAGDLSGGGGSDPQGILVWYSWYGACYQNGGLQCPISLSWPWEGSYSGGYLEAPGWEGFFFFPCDYCCLGLGVTDSCNRSGYGEACHSLHSP